MRFYQRRRALWLSLLLLTVPMGDSHASGASVLPEPGSVAPESAAAASSIHWLEVTPLDRKDQPQVLLDVDVEAPLELAAGRWMLCVGGETVAVRCSFRLSEGGLETPPEPGPGTELVGTVVVGGRAAPEVRISVLPASLASRRPFALPLTWDPESEALVRDVATDLEGNFRIPPLAPGDYRLEVVPNGGRVQTVGPFSVPAPETVLARGQDPTVVQAVWDLGELTFDSGMAVEVLVTDMAGAPLSSAKVGARQGKPPDVDFFETVADEEGKAVLSGLDPTAPVHIVCVAEGYVRMAGTFEVPPSSTHCSMEQLAGAYGRVVDGDEESVSGAVVTLVGKGRSVRTDADGAFTLDQLASGTYEIEVSAPGFRLETIELSLTAGESLDLGPIVVYPGELLLGEVVEASSGDPLAGAEVRVVEPPGGAHTLTDAEGLFELQADPDRPPAVRVEVAGYPRHRQQISAAAFENGERVRFEIRPGGRIEVRAWSREGDAPCSGCEFQVTGLGERWPKLVTGSEGRAVSDPLPEGRYSVSRVAVRSSGSVVLVSGGQNVRWADVTPGETTRVEFGEPTLPLQVHFHPAPPSDWSLSARGADWNRKAETLAPGVFQLQRPPGESLDLILRGPEGETLHAATLPAEFDRDSFETDLPAGRVRGRLMHADAPAQGVDVAVLDARQGTRQATARSKKDGSFALLFLPAGTYHLMAEDHVLRTFSVTAGSDVVFEEILVERAGN